MRSLTAVPALLALPSVCALTLRSSDQAVLGKRDGYAAALNDGAATARGGGAPFLSAAAYAAASEQHFRRVNADIVRDPVGGMIARCLNAQRIIGVGRPAPRHAPAPVVAAAPAELAHTQLAAGVEIPAFSSIPTRLDAQQWYFLDLVPAENETGTWTPAKGPFRVTPWQQLQYDPHWSGCGLNSRLVNVLYDDCGGRRNGQLQRSGAGSAEIPHPRPPYGETVKFTIHHDHMFADVTKGGKLVTRRLLFYYDGVRRDFDAEMCGKWMVD